MRLLDVALIVGLALAGLVGWLVSSAYQRRQAVPPPSGHRTLISDFRGVQVATAPYQRIASLSWQADGILLHLVGRERLVCVSQVSDTPLERLTSGMAHVRGVEDLEALLRLQPDVVVMNTAAANPAAVERLRAAGLAVFDLGPAAGWDSFLNSLRTLGDLVQVSESARAYAQRLTLRQQALQHWAQQFPAQRALYLASYAGQLSGGAEGTSYADVLRFSGFTCCASAQGLRGWPALTPEEVLRMNPERLLLRQGQAETLRQLPGLAALPALRQPGGVIEVPGALLDDPGLYLLDAVEAVLSQR